MKKYQIKLDVTQEQLQKLIMFAEDEKDFHLTYGNQEELEEWIKIRDRLAYELDMISNYPFENNNKKDNLE